MSSAGLPRPWPMASASPSSLCHCISLSPSLSLVAACVVCCARVTRPCDGVDEEDEDGHGREPWAPGRLFQTSMNVTPGRPAQVIQKQRRSRTGEAMEGARPRRGDIGGTATGSSTGGASGSHRCSRRRGVAA
jgi:hypothetical protein